MAPSKKCMAACLVVGVAVNLQGCGMLKGKDCTEMEIENGNIPGSAKGANVTGKCADGYEWEGPKITCNLVNKVCEKGSNGTKCALEYEFGESGTGLKEWNSCAEPKEVDELPADPAGEFHRFLEKAKEKAHAAKEKASAAVHSAKEKVSKAADGVKDKLKDAKEKASAAIDSAKEKASKAADGVKEKLNDAKEKASAVKKALTEKFPNPGDSATEDGKATTERRLGGEKKDEKAEEAPKDKCEGYVAAELPKCYKPDDFKGSCKLKAKKDDKAAKDGDGAKVEKVEKEEKYELTGMAVASTGSSSFFAALAGLASVAAVVGAMSMSVLRARRVQGFSSPPSFIDEAAESDRPVE